MSLSERLPVDLKEALKTGDKTTVSVLRMVKATIKNKEIEKRASLSDDEIYGILRSFVKRCKESIEQFSKAGRADFVKKETEELSIIQSYLPQQLTEDEARILIKDTIVEIGARGQKDMGKVMKAVMAKVEGRLDGKLVNLLVKKMLDTENTL